MAADNLSSVVRWTEGFNKNYRQHLEVLKESFLVPLRTWGLIDSSDIALIFSNFDDVFSEAVRMDKLLRELSHSLERKDLIYTIFTTPLLQILRFYCRNHARSEKAVARCLQKHDRFGAFVNIQQRKTKSTLEKLLRKPVDSVIAFHEVLRKLVSLLSKDGTSAEFKELLDVLKSWDDLIEELDQLRKKRENEEKLTSIELSFPKDKLVLVPQGEVSKQEKRTRRLSAPGAILKFMAQEAKHLQQTVAKSRKSSVSLSYQSGEDNTEQPTERQYIGEGAVTIVQNDEPKKRYLFLFNDLLIIAKPRVQGNYTLKGKIYLKYAWVLPRAPSPPRKGIDLSFVVGGPAIRKLKVVCKSQKEKEAWLTPLMSAIEACKQQTSDSYGRMNIFPYISAKRVGTTGIPTCETVEAGNTATSSDVVRLVLEKLDGTDPQANALYCLWEVHKYGVHKLETWECPYAIVAAGKYAQMHNDTCHFVLRLCSAHELTVDMLPPNLKQVIAQGSPRVGRRMVSRDGKEEKKNKLKTFRRHSSDILRKLTPGRSSSNSKLPEHPEPKEKKTGLLFGVLLADLLRNGNELPVPIQDMLTRLYSDGPTAIGLFRKSANARLIRVTKERLDQGLPVDFSEVPILAVGALFKEFLRSLPECLFPLSLYNEFVMSNAMHENEADCLGHIRKSLSKLPPAHILMLQALMPVLTHICENSEENAMTASNLAICVGQSMMWPEKAEDVLKNEVPPFIEYLILHADKFFSLLAPPFVIQALATPEVEDETSRRQSEELDPSPLRTVSAPGSHRSTPTLGRRSDERFQSQDELSTPTTKYVDGHLETLIPVEPPRNRMARPEAIRRSTESLETTIV